MPHEETAFRTLEGSGALAAIERERFASYSALVRNLHWLAAALVILYALVSEDANPRSPWNGGFRLSLSPELATLLVLAGSMVLYTLALHSRLFARFSLEERMWAETGIDLSWITAVVLFTGAARSPFFFLYYMVIFASTPSTSRAQTYGKAGAVTLLVLGIILPLGAGAGTSLGLASRREWTGFAVSLVWPLTGVWLVAYFSAETGALGANLHRSLFIQAHTDGLTGLPNVRYFTSAADLRDKLGGPYTIVMVDADRLKSVNDTHGHAIGSELIRTVADAIRSAARSDDLCSRIGGDEFIVRLANASEAGALAYCRRVRAYLGDHPLKIDGNAVLPISVSMGVAACPKHGRTLSEVTRRADEALYRSKLEGRSRDNIWAA
jgi:diguanylate cyclase (GGDEF)-like protein